MGQHPRSFRIVSFFKAALRSACFLALAPISAGGQSNVIDLAGKAMDPFEVARGKVVVLIFVRTDCPISNRYAPVIQRLSAQNTEKAEFFLVYPDKKESAEAIRKHDQEFGYKIAALRDPQHVLVKQSRAQITPEVAVFDAERKLIYHGRIDNLYEDFGHARKSATTHELRDAIQAAINGKTLGTDATPAVGCYISDLE
jgi:thiol-disulfide isomerase/thioredoxin